MKTPDPASLQNLNDIVLPMTVGWWPLAAGWYYLIGFLLLMFFGYGYHALQRWLQNRYRREALRELQLLAEDIKSAAKRDSSLRQIPILLKRTALAVYPRSQVAVLSGQDWFHFLNSTLKNPIFNEPITGTLNTISYTCGELNAVDSQATTALLNVTRQWLQYHQSTVRLMGDEEI